VEHGLRPETKPSRAEAQRSENYNPLSYPASPRLCARHDSSGFRDSAVTISAKRTQFARPGPGSSKSEARNPKQIQMANDTNGGKQRDRGRTCKTNPISPGRRRWTEKTVRNEPNFAPPNAADGGNAQNKPELGRTGVFGQWQSCRPWPGRRVKRAKRTQFARPGPGRMPEAECAKRSQFGSRARKWARGGRPRGPAGGRLCKTNPISAAPGGCRRSNAQNEAKPGETGVCGQRPPCGPLPGRGVKRAKRTQFLDCGLGLGIERDVGRACRAAALRAEATYEEAKRAKRTQFARRGQAL
jgi:hypothetical protein